MIQAQDLRLGNLLRHKNGEICTVALLSYGRNIGLSEICIDSNDELQPIPLTEQILLDSGFDEIKQYHNAITERIFHFKRTGETGIYVSISKGFRHITFYLASGGNVEIPCHSTQFVHDLQNAFYMATGKELNIVIK